MHRLRAYIHRHVLLRIWPNVNLVLGCCRNGYLKRQLDGDPAPAKRMRMEHQGHAGASVTVQQQLGTGACIQRFPG